MGIGDLLIGGAIVYGIEEAGKARRKRKAATRRRTIKTPPKPRPKSRTVKRKTKRTKK